MLKVKDYQELLLLIFLGLSLCYGLPLIQFSWDQNTYKPTQLVMTFVMGTEDVIDLPPDRGTVTIGFAEFERFRALLGVKLVHSDGIEHYFSSADINRQWEASYRIPAYLKINLTKR